MKDDDFGQDLPLAAVPLKGELNVGAGRITMLQGVVA
jgi:hypothetical protein